MLDILAIKADVYQLERQGKRLPVYRYLREVWQKEPPSEGLTVLALQQMVDYVEYVDDLTVLGEPWEAENEYDLYQDFLLDVISWGLQKYRTKKRFLWQICYYVNAWATFYYIFGREITQENVEQWKKTLFEEAKERYPDSLLFEFIPHAAQLDYVWFYRLTDEQRLQIRLEVGEWNLQKNDMDQAVQSDFDDALTWYRDNGRKLLEAKKQGKQYSQFECIGGNTMKRIRMLLAAFTALFLLMSALPAQAGSPEISDLLTEYYKEWQDLPFGLTEDELTCVDGVLYGRDILLLYPKTRTDACFVIPDGIGYVWDFAFVGNDLLEKVVVPDSCKILGAFAFWECANLAEVEFGANSELLIVDDFCFSECYALQQIRLPDSVYLIGEAAFSYTQIQRFVFPEQIVFIGDQLFWGTPVTELTFHAWSLPQYIGSEYFSIDDDDAEYRITLPFDADADRYLGNAEYVMQKENVTVLFCEDTDMPEDE